jgi:signal transduction histidine kinase
MRLSPVGWLVVMTAVLSSALVGSTILLEQHAGQLDARSADIVDNAAPSITELAAARSELRHLELGVGRYLGARIAGLALSPAQIRELRVSVDEHIKAHERMPCFEGEQALTDALKRSKMRLYEDLDRVVAHVDAGRNADARAVMFGPVTIDADAVDALIVQLIVLNNDHAATAAREIATQRRHTSLLAFGVDAASVLLAALLLVAAVRAARFYHRALDERRRLAEARAGELDHFASRVAHDLKGPLASVMLGTSVAAEHPSETQRALEKVQKTSRLMNQMIDALLAVARVEPERPGAHPTSVAEVINVIVDELRPVAEAAGATLRVEPFAATTAIGCSAGVLASVLSNLLHNALKYIGESKGERLVRLRVLERSDCVRFEVDDTGPGVPPDLCDHVFERYVRGQRSTGLGLGLATVKHLVEGAGGRLGVKSTAGKGACFWVELPRATTERARLGSAIST